VGSSPPRYIGLLQGQACRDSTKKFANCWKPFRANRNLDGEGLEKIAPKLRRDVIHNFDDFSYAFENTNSNFIQKNCAAAWRSSAQWRISTHGANGGNLRLISTVVSRCRFQAIDFGLA
jgi:hypothetical protein